MPAKINIPYQVENIAESEILKRLEELKTLNEISVAITSTLDIQETLTIITQQTVSLLQVEASSIALIEDDENPAKLPQLLFVAASGAGSENILNKKIALGTGLVGWVSQYGEPELITNVSADRRFFSEFDKHGGFTTRSLLCVPLISKGIIIGAIQVLNKIGGQLNQEDLRRLTSIAAPAATAIENARLYLRAQQEIEERVKIEAALQYERTQLEARIQQRTKELRKVNQELAKAARMKDEFLASMSHELRTPLNTIIGNADAVQGGIYGDHIEKDHRAINMIMESGQHLLALINDILDISKIEAGKVQLDFAPTSLSTIIESSLQYISQEATNKGISVHYQPQPALGIVHVDGRRLKQTLINLLSNAVKFTQNGGNIGLKADMNKSANKIQFVVWDTGIGIPQDQLETIFEPFIQVDSKLSRKYAGTGLGLVLAHRMIQLHHGHIQVESELGIGSKFTIELPIEPPNRKETEYGFKTIANIRTQKSVSTLSTNSKEQQKTILIVEDHVINLETLSDFLMWKGYTTITAKDGQQAIDKLDENDDIDLVLMDIQMPIMDGIEAIKKIRAKARFSSLPIIALTALAMIGDKERCLQAGATDYATKPVVMSEVTNLIGKYVGQPIRVN
jgi:signal transduction histidine kinase/ActR/RegA family two-component response regulator